MRIAFLSLLASSLLPAQIPGSFKQINIDCGGSYFPKDPDRGIWKSTDAGKAWRQVKAGIYFSENDKARHGGEYLAIHPSNDSEVWAGSQGDGLWRSTDGGKSGKTHGTILRLFPYPDDILTYAHSAVAHGDRIIAAGGAPTSGEARIWRSGDKGLTWKKLRAEGLPSPAGWLGVDYKGNHPPRNSLRP